MRSNHLIRRGQRGAKAVLQILLGAILLGSVGCAEPDIDRVFGIEERRQVMTAPLAASAESVRAFEVRVPVGVSRRRVSLDAVESLHVGRGASVVGARTETGSLALGTLVALGSVRIDSGARIGALYALGEAPQIDPGAEIDGFVESARPVVVGGAAARLGVMDRFQPVVEAFDLSAGVGTPGQSTLEAVPGSFVDAPPGSYLALTVLEGATARVHAGSYTFETLDLRAGATLELDNTGGPIRLWIAGILRLEGRLVDFVRDGSVLVGYGGDRPIDLANSLAMTLLAPHAAVRLRASAAPHRGAVFARSIVLDDGATLEHVPLALAGSPTSAAVVCRICQVASRIEAARVSLPVRTREVPCDFRNECVHQAEVRGSEDDYAGALAGAELDAEETSELVSRMFDQCENRYGFRTETCASLGLRSPSR